MRLSPDPFPIFEGGDRQRQTTLATGGGAARRVVIRNLQNAVLYKLWFPEPFNPQKNIGYLHKYYMRMSPDPLSKKRVLLERLAVQLAVSSCDDKKH